MGPFISEEILGQESIRAGADVSHAVKDLNCENLVLHKGGGREGVWGPKLHLVHQDSLRCSSEATAQESVSQHQHT